MKEITKYFQVTAERNRNNYPNILKNITKFVKIITFKYQTLYDYKIMHLRINHLFEIMNYACHYFSAIESITMCQLLAYNFSMTNLNIS